MRMQGRCSKVAVFAVGIGMVLGITQSAMLEVEAEEYVYDDLNRVIKVLYDDGGVVEYVYDSNGNIVSTIVSQVKSEDMTDSEKIDEEDISSEEQNLVPEQPEIVADEMYNPPDEVATPDISGETGNKISSPTVDKEKEVENTSGGNVMAILLKRILAYIKSIFSQFMGFWKNIFN